MGNYYMDLSIIFSLLQNNYFANFLATTILNSTVSALGEKASEHNIFWQLLDCMQKAHQDTCEMLGWEYNPDAFSNFVIDIGDIASTLYSEEKLSSIFLKSIGHPMDRNAIECWLSNFKLRLAAKEYETLREFIKLQLLFKERNPSELQMKYIERFTNPQYLDSTHSFTLSELYIPNNYRIGNVYGSFNDLLELIIEFRNHKIEKFLNTKGIHISEDIFALFITGHQCTGKSALISKIIFDYNLNEFAESNSLYVVSFGDKTFCNKEFNINTICEYLCINRRDLHGSTLLVDGLDESRMSSSIALSKVEQLIYDLREINCKLIITSRPNFVFTNELRFAWEITLQPFSEAQAFEWLEIFQSVSPLSNFSSIRKQITNLSPELKSIDDKYFVRTRKTL